MEHLFKLGTDDLSVLEKRFYRYQLLDREIAVRKEELRQKEPDENIGGGKPNTVSKTLEIQVIKEQSDPFIMERQKWKRAIDEVYDEGTELEREVMDVKFFSGQNYLSWRDVAEQVHYSKTKIYEVRYAILEKFARKIGYI